MIHCDAVLCSFNDTVMLQSAYLPKLNYVPVELDSSTLGSRSAADTTAVYSAVNAAAVKYLTDQQLVQQVTAAAAGRRTTSGRSKDANHQQKSVADNVLSNASVYGLKASNLSMASRKYFEKHGLAVGHAPAAVGQDSRRVRNQTASRSHRKDLIESISSQVNNLCLASSPGRSRTFNGDLDISYDPSLYDVGGQGDVTCISAQNVTSSWSDAGGGGDDGSGKQQRRIYESEDRSVLSDTTYNHSHAYNHSQGRRHHHGPNNMILRAVDRTLEFSDSVVVDSPEPRQQRSYNRLQASAMRAENRS